MRNIFTIVLLNVCFLMLAQTNLESSNKTLPTITRPSPTVAQLMKVEEANIDNYTGQPNIMVPLFNKNIKKLNVDLVLSYNSSGARVSEQSGWVGKGWSLSAGGVISRTVMDLPDEINFGKFKGVNYNIYHDFWNYPENGETRREYVYDTQWGTLMDVDSRNDIYQFNFFGKTGRFVFSKVNNVLQPVMIGVDNNYRIEVNYTSTQAGLYPVEIASFIITDDMGYKYYFTEKEKTEKKDVTMVYKQDGCDDPVAPETPPSIGKFISAWHLSRVEDENGIQLLEISYTNILEKPKVPISRTEYVAYNLHTVHTEYGPGCTASMRCALKPRKITVNPQRDIETKKINRITFQDNSSVRFFLSANHPEYREGKGAYLQRLEIHNNQSTSPISSYHFGYSSSGPLFLKDIKINNSNLEKYSFEYFKETDYPLYETEDKDVFGYPNFSYPFVGSVYKGLLTRVVYPTKGMREFTWEPNTYSYKGDKLLSFVEIMNNPDNYTLVDRSVNDTYINGNQSNRPFNLFYVPYEQEVDLFFNTSTNYYFDPETTIPNWLKIMPVLSEINHALDTSRQNLSYSIGINEYGTGKVHLEPGWYKMHFSSLNFLVSGGNIAGNATLKIKNAKSALNWFLYGGGARIRTIVDKDNGTDQIIKSYKYDFENLEIIPLSLPPLVLNPALPNPLTFSSGSLDGIDNLVREYSVNITPIYNIPQVLDNPVEYKVYEKQNEIDANLCKGNFIGYKNVFEYSYSNTDPIYRSKIKYTFDSPIDYPSNISNGYPYFPIESNDYKQSNIRKIEYFDAANNPALTEDFKYNYDGVDIRKQVKKNFYFVANENYFPSICQAVRILFTSYYNLKVNFISAAQYAINCTGASSPLAQAFLDYDKSSCIEALIEPYTFLMDYSYKVQLIEHTKKEYFGTNIIETKDIFTYNAKNYQSGKTTLLSTGDAIQTRLYYPQDTEMASIPYRSQLTAKNIISIPVKSFDLKNGEIISVRETEYGSLPVPFQDRLYPKYESFGNGSVTEKRITFSQYDNQGNIVEIIPGSGQYVCYIWGYNKTLPVAKIEGIPYEAIPTALIMGVENATNATSYNEADVIAALTALRNTPELAESMVTGYLYNPQVGMTAVIDPRGNKTTFLYDSFGRLELVKDHEGKLLSQHSYNYRP